MLAEPDPHVINWMDSQATESLFLSTISVAELRVGVQLLPDGHRRDRLHDALERRVLPRFTNRILVFDLPASQEYALLMASAKLHGRSIAVSDGFIAAIAAANGMMVATRDISPFEASGLKTIDPWSYQGDGA